MQDNKFSLMRSYQQIAVLLIQNVHEHWKYKGIVGSAENIDMVRPFK